MYNSPFRNKSIDKANSTGKATTSNAMMSAGPGDPPKKGTRKPGDQLRDELDKFESMSNEARQQLSFVTSKDLQKQRELISRLPGGIEALDKRTGGTSRKESGKLTTLEDVAKTKGVTKTEASGDIRRRAITMSKSNKSKD